MPCCPRLCLPFENNSNEAFVLGMEVDVWRNFFPKVLCIQVQYWILFWCSFTFCEIPQSTIISDNL